MKQSTLIIMSIFMIVFSLQGQEYKKLNVFLTEVFDSRASITVETLKSDPLIAIGALKNALAVNNFKVISERVAKEKSDGSVVTDFVEQNSKYGYDIYLNNGLYSDNMNVRLKKAFTHLIGLNGGRVISDTFKFNIFKGMNTNRLLLEEI